MKRIKKMIKSITFGIKNINIIKKVNKKKKITKKKKNVINWINQIHYLTLK